eukprot:gnl/Carplike_NY0171/10484_a14775_114.p1 GENE.gnl/Carplike_NY0171/10484_a14775_114~~gnl/Carplike_NY0171/10484_a14775_114.p1  ORF type:complete len:138 (+),score=2.52 gnl/Carplike_NY0171/10484_a14775_114:219-632(+)
MNKKVKKITTWLATAVFLLALVINIKVTLDDPFVMLSDEAVAQTTGTGNSGSSSGTSVLWYKTDGDCSVTYEGHGIVTSEITITKYGRTWTIPVGYNFDVSGTWKITYEDVAIDCSAGGNSQCHGASCASFWASLDD